MQYVTIPTTDLNTAAICMGTTFIGSTIDHQQSVDLLDLYAESGGNFIDTASVYANWLSGEKHQSEKTVGRWLAERGLRNRIVLATKGAHPHMATMDVHRMSRADIEEDLNTSLVNLQTDVIDLYWLHRDDPSRPVEEILDTLNAQVQAGKIRYFGCSNWRAPRIREAQEIARARGIDGFVADQMLWSAAVIDPAGIADPTMVAMDDDLYTLHQASGLAAIPYSSQAGGLFQKLAQGNLQVGDAYQVAPNQARLARLEEIARSSGLSITQVVLGYLRAQPFVTIPIVGSRTPGQLADTLRAADVRLSADQVALVDAAL
jgi:aryl-alcohol dehydrogenase-like predicted oxidoreductase